MQENDYSLSRRGLLAGAGALAGSLLIGWRESAAGAHAATENTLATWLRIDADSQVTVFVAAAEMGQGVMTALPALVAEELGVDWTQVRAEMPPSAGQFRTMRGRRITGNSQSVVHFFKPMRRAGAAARDMLISAAATQWQVAAAECSIRQGIISHTGSDNSAPIGQFAAAAALLPVPKKPTLSAPENWQLIGKPLPRTDIPAKIDGSAVYGIDVEIDGMQAASIMACPAFGGRLASVDPAPALKLAGVSQVVELDNAVAVVADHTWHALQGLKALQPEWDLTDASKDNSQDIEAAQMATPIDAGKPGKVTGDTAQAFAAAANIVEAQYQVPFLAHLCLEPMNATAHVEADRVTVWAPTQAESDTAVAVAAAVGQPAEQVTVHSTMIGGGFGRRSYTDFAVQAAQIAQAAGTPVKLTWSREEDVRQDHYRPAMGARYRGALDDQGKLTGIEANVVGPSLIDEFKLPPKLDTMINTMAVSGDGYKIENQKLSYARRDVGVPLGIWRSVLLSENGFFAESFMDEMAAAAGRDPLAFRRDLTAGNAQSDSTLDLLAELFDFSARQEKNRGWGMAMAAGWGCVCAVAVDVTLEKNNRVRINDMAAAMHAGQVINPAIVSSQVQGGLLYGLCASLWGDIEIRDGRVIAGNFDSQPVLRMNQAPAIRVGLVPSDGKPGGVGELSTSVAAPALVNAIVAAGGERSRQLPLSRDGFNLVV
jgi:isoquinoline 1-oxidoreductase beta subunit